MNPPAGAERRRPGAAEELILMSETVIETRNLTKEFVRDEFHVVALQGRRHLRSTRANSWR